MNDPRVQLLDDLIEGCDNIPGASLDLGKAGDVWLHTNAQVADWLREERHILLEAIRAERRALGEVETDG